MKLRIAVCDDDARQADALAASAAAWAQDAGQPCETAVFLSAEAFLFAPGPWDILLLDVEMPGMSGTELARRLRESDSRVQIVFITSHFEFMGEGYEVDALHYLVKPVETAKLSAVLDKAAARLAEEPPSLVVVSDGETVKLYERDILYAEARAHDTAIRTAKAEYRVRESIGALAARLSADFFQTHRSYYVSLKHVRRISRTAVTLDDGTEVPLARGRYDAVNRAYIERN